MTMVQALNDALKVEMRRNPKIVLFGEDVAINGGVFRVTEGLYQEFGPNRVFDTPLAESGIIGVAIGMALYGLKPVVEIQFLDFIYPAFDQIVNELAKMRYRTGGQFSAPIVIRAPFGGGVKGGLYHSQSTETFFIHTAGLKVVAPSTPYDAKGLLISSMRAEDPVLFLEPKRVYRAVREDVPQGDYVVPIGQAKRVRDGSDVTVFSYGSMVHVVLEAAKKAEEKGLNVEVIDLRTLWPIDIDSIITSVKKTGRVVIVHDAPKTLGLGAEISALIAERAIEYLAAPILRVTGFDTPFPYALEDYYLPNVQRVIRAINKVMSYS
jgi:Pyruvate/2-oxoglutarate dehydrogenase complex, dehydrogenase (E1) component, eukaryotic type, beta subunit